LEGGYIPKVPSGVVFIYIEPKRLSLFPLKTGKKKEKKKKTAKIPLSSQNKKNRKHRINGNQVPNLRGLHQI